MASRVRIAIVAAAAALGLVLAGCSAGGSGSDSGAAAARGHGGDAQPVAVKVAGTPAAAGTAGPDAPGRVITVTGIGTVSGTPDTLTLQLGVQTRGSTAGQALSANNSKAAAVIAALEHKGIAKKDLQTSRLSIEPTYADGKNTVTGYQVSNMVTATVHDVGAAGSLIDAAQQVAGDAIRLDQVGFSFADDSSLRAKARADAVKQALAQARQLADAAGLKVGPVQSITEGSASAPPTPVYAAAGSAAGPAMPVLAGSQDLTVTVQVVVAIG